jgi:hypothetical protein
VGKAVAFNKLRHRVLEVAVGACLLTLCLSRQQFHLRFQSQSAQAARQSQEALLVLPLQMQEALVLLDHS